MNAWIGPHPKRMMALVAAVTVGVGLGLVVMGLVRNGAGDWLIIAVGSGCVVLTLALIPLARRRGRR
ncbi:hypothetical protein [Asanoa sp. NPDC050611]|uniref:hypothetical protein n=1 Tax=Asanoa sp. NPDC050611 TaxID=3157098 RepID=UPI003400D5D3